MSIDKMANIKDVTNKITPGNLKVPFNIEETIKEINTHICTAQTHLLSTSREFITNLEKEDFKLPTVYQQIVNESGQSEIKKVSEVSVPFGYFLVPGVFQISKVDVEIPFKVDLDKESTRTENISSQKNAESNVTVTLKLSYEYQKLSNYSVPAIISFNPIIDLKFNEYSIDPEFKTRCKATGFFEVKNEKTGTPLSRQKIYLNIDEGNIIPAEGILDNAGKIEFTITGNCQEDKKFVSSLLVVLNGVKRNFSVVLTP